jgi:hypothetical protein
MKVLLDNMPKDCITEEQKKKLIKDARRFGANYLIYGMEFEGIHYFHYGIFKDRRPQKSGIPVFYFVDKHGNIQKAHPSIDAYLAGMVGGNVINLLSNNQY